MVDVDEDTQIVVPKGQRLEVGAEGQQQQQQQQQEEEQVKHEGPLLEFEAELPGAAGAPHRRATLQARPGQGAAEVLRRAGFEHLATDATSGKGSEAAAAAHWQQVLGVELARGWHGMGARILRTGILPGVRHTSAAAPPPLLAPAPDVAAVAAIDVLCTSLRLYLATDDGAVASAPPANVTASPPAPAPAATALSTLAEAANELALALKHAAPALCAAAAAEEEPRESTDTSAARALLRKVHQAIRALLRLARARAPQHPTFLANAGVAAAEAAAAAAAAAAEAAAAPKEQQEQGEEEGMGGDAAELRSEAAAAFEAALALAPGDRAMLFSSATAAFAAAEAAATAYGAGGMHSSKGCGNSSEYGAAMAAASSSAAEAALQVYREWLRPPADVQLELRQALGGGHGGAADGWPAQSLVWATVLAAIRLPAAALGQQQSTEQSPAMHRLLRVLGSGWLNRACTDADANAAGAALLRAAGWLQRSGGLDVTNHLLLLQEQTGALGAAWAVVVRHCSDDADMAANTAAAVASAAAAVAAAAPSAILHPTAAPRLHLVLEHYYKRANRAGSGAEQRRRNELLEALGRNWLSGPPFDGGVHVLLPRQALGALLPGQSLREALRGELLRVGRAAWERYSGAVDADAADRAPSSPAATPCLVGAVLPTAAARLSFARLKPQGRADVPPNERSPARVCGQTCGSR